MGTPEHGDPPAPFPWKMINLRIDASAMAEASKLVGSTGEKRMQQRQNRVAEEEEEESKKTRRSGRKRFNIRGDENRKLFREVILGLLRNRIPYNCRGSLYSQYISDARNME